MNSNCLGPSAFPEDDALGLALRALDFLMGFLARENPGRHDNCVLAIPERPSYLLGELEFLAVVYSWAMLTSSQASRIVKIQDCCILDIL